MRTSNAWDFSCQNSRDIEKSCWTTIQPHKPINKEQSQFSLADHAYSCYINQGLHKWAPKWLQWLQPSQNDHRRLEEISAHREVRCLCRSSNNVWLEGIEQDEITLNLNKVHLRTSSESTFRCMLNAFLCMTIIMCLFQNQSINYYCNESGYYYIYYGQNSGEFEMSVYNYFLMPISRTVASVSR